MEKEQIKIKQNRIQDLIEKLRDQLHEPRKQYELLQDRNHWIQLWVCVDTIADINEMLNEYSKIKKFDSPNHGRIMLYGILQGMYIQQDALENLLWIFYKDNKKSKKDRKIYWDKDYQDVWKIREARDSFAGHPTDDGKGYHLIQPNYIDVTGFSVWSEFKKGDFKQEYIPLKKLLRQQQIAICNILDNLIKEIEYSEMKHKKKFTNESLLTIIKNVDYGLSKLNESIFSDNYGISEFAKVTFETVKEMYQKFINGIINRYGSIEAIDHFEDLKRKIDYDIEKINSFLDNNQMFMNPEAEVFSDHLKMLFMKLSNLAKEIDEEF